METSSRGEKRKSDSLRHDENANASHTACDNCKAKKYKCSKEHPACLLCLRHERPCHYSGRVVRSPLTRAYLTQIENRLQAMETAFSHLLPGVDIDDAISSLSSPEVKTQSPAFGLLDSMTPAAETDPVPEDESPEALPQQPDGFDWKEEAPDMHGLSDGMAALSVETSGIGYLGATSSVGFLRSLQPWITKQNISLSSNYDPLHSPKSRGDSNSSISQMPEHALSHQLITRFIDSYFSTYHILYPFIHEATFRAQFNEQVKRPEKYAWDILLYSILALGAWTSEAEDNELHDVFYRKAISPLQERFILESGSVPLVQALLLLSNYTQKQNKMNTGWNFLGLAVRVAIGLGLHKELPKWNVNVLQRETRRRVWWSLYVLDSGASKTSGRPVLLPDNETMDIKQVLNVHDELLTPLTVMTPSEVDEPTLYSGLIAAADFHLTANKILKRLLSSTGISAREAMALNVFLTRWSHTLPAYFQIDRSPVSSSDWYIFARSRLWWKFWNLQITMTRPFLHQWVLRCFGPGQNLDASREEMECKALCINSAHETINSVGHYIHQIALTKVMSWYALYFLFHAALVIAVCLWADPSSPDSLTWANDVEIAKAALATEFAADKLASRCLDILSALNPQAPSDVAGDILPPLLPEEVLADFSYWSSTAADPLNLFDWPVLGDGFT